MKVRMMQEPAPARAQRDGPSPAQQAQQAAIDELAASLAATQARIQQLIANGAEQTQAGRNELSEARREMTETALQLRQLADAQRQLPIDGAIRDAATRVIVGPGGVGPGRTSTGVATNEIPDIPQGAQDVAMLFIVCLAAAIILTPLMRAFGRIIERRAVPPARLAPEIQSQLVRMEQAIDAIAVEVERVAEGQRFATRMLADRDKIGELRS